MTIVLNSRLQKYGGDLYVATITIMQSVMQLIIAPLQGVHQGTQPIPLALILPRLFGVYGIYYAEPISDIIAPLVTTLLFLLLFSSIMEKEMGAKK